MEPGGKRELLKIKLAKIDIMGRVSVGRELAGKEVLIAVAKPRKPFDELYWRWADGKQRTIPAFIEQKDGSFIPNPLINELEQVLEEARTKPED